MQYNSDQIVYFIEDPHAGYVKIGVATDVRKRMAQLQCSHGHPLKLLGTMSGGRPVEKNLHEMFARYKVRREWFKLSDEIKEFIDEYTGDKGAAFEISAADTVTPGRPKLRDGDVRVAMSSFASRSDLQERFKLVAKLRGDKSPNNLIEEAMWHTLMVYDKKWCLEQADKAIRDAERRKEQILKVFDSPN